MIQFELTGVKDLQDAFADWSVRCGIANENIVKKGGLLIADAAKNQFLGGGKSARVDATRPTSRSNNARNSILVKNARGRELSGKFSKAGVLWSAQVGPTVIYGRRLELGYHGTDSLGRNYGNPGQSPRPFLSVGLKEAEPAVRDLATAEYLAAQEA